MKKERTGCGLRFNPGFGSLRHIAAIRADPLSPSQLYTSMSRTRPRGKAMFCAEMEFFLAVRIEDVLVAAVPRLAERVAADS